MSNIEMKGAVVEGGWRHSNKGNQRFLGLTVQDPISGANVAEIELDERQVLDILSGVHRGTVGGSVTIYGKGIERIGKAHAMVTVKVNTEGDYGKGSLDALNVKFFKAWERAGGYPWVPVTVTSWNGHRHVGNIYTEVMHGYFDPTTTVEDLQLMLDGPEFSDVRIHQKDSE
jgi:hypothetical protein